MGLFYCFLYLFLCCFDFSIFMVSIEGVRQTSAVLAAGQDSDGEHEGYIEVWGLIRGLAEGGRFSK